MSDVCYQRKRLNSVSGILELPPSTVQSFIYLKKKKKKKIRNVLNTILPTFLFYVLISSNIKVTVLFPNIYGKFTQF